MKITRENTSLQPVHNSNGELFKVVIDLPVSPDSTNGHYCLESIFSLDLKAAIAFRDAITSEEAQKE